MHIAVISEVVVVLSEVGSDVLDCYGGSAGLVAAYREREASMMYPERVGFRLATVPMIGDVIVANRALYA
jgi:hypothetical protein